MRTSLSLVTAVFFTTSLCLAGGPAKEPKYATVGKIAPVTLAPGKAGEAVVKVTVNKGFHVQANPASNPQLIPTKVELTGNDSVIVGEPAYPPGKPYRLAGAAADIATYDGKFEIKIPLTAAAGAKAGKRELAGKLRYQACNDKICFFPQSLPVSVSVRIK